MSLNIPIPSGSSLSSSIQVAANALNSYSRSQAFYGTNFARSADATSLEDEEDEEGAVEGEDADEDGWDGVIGETIDEDEVFEPGTFTESHMRPALEDETPRPTDLPRAKQHQPTADYFESTESTLGMLPPSTSERSPLLQKSPMKPRTASTAAIRRPSHLAPPFPRLRNARLSSASLASLSVPHRPPRARAPSWRLLRRQIEAPLTQAPGTGTSTFGQTLFNTIAILLGVGVLSESLAFAYAGWIGGFFLLIFYALITCYTAKILARIMALDTRIRTYSDISRAAFGPRSMWLTNAMFFLELFTLSVVLVVLFSDSMHEIYPSVTSDTWKLVSLTILIPTVFLPLNLLSFTSILGILSILLLVLSVLYDGLSKRTPPGSLFSPSPTSLLPTWRRLPISFGLLMSSFSGHTVIPSLARDMKNPEHFDRMISWAFGIATVIYAVIASAGYVMFGNAVSDEVSKDLMNTPGYNELLNYVMAWGLVINPLSKFALCTRPLNNTIESALGMDAPSHTLHALSPSDKAILPGRNALFSRHTLLLVISRTLLTVTIVLAAVLVPAFEIVMSFLGAFSAFALCVIGPIWAKCAVEGRWWWVDIVIVGLAVLMAIAGTASGFYV